MTTPVDIAIIGAGAAGLSAAIFAGRAAQERGVSPKILVLEGAKKPGAKILVSGGGRCNVTNQKVTPDDYSGGTRPVIRNVLRAFDEQHTLEWFREMGVQLKLEPTGKYFPISDKARTVLDALLRETADSGVELRSGARVARVEPGDGQFRIVVHDSEPVMARRVIIATGGLSLPKSGSDGAGLNWMRQLGHSIAPTSPALVPLLLGPVGDGPQPGDRFAELAGLSMDAVLRMPASAGGASRAGSLLFTHFGISGPAAMDISRHVTQFALTAGNTDGLQLLMGAAAMSGNGAEAWLQKQAEKAPHRSLANAVGEFYPERMAKLMTEGLGEKLGALTRENRRRLAQYMSALPLHVVGNRGYSFAETTAGGVELSEIDYRTMHSRKVPGLFICGEMLDVDGRIGGFNFQWAWASGYLAGRGAVTSLQ